jgi:predicted phosphodiesterase
LLRSPIVFRLALLAGLIFASSRVVAPVTFHLGSGDLSLRLRPDLPGGRVILPLGPFGELSWHTHRSPLDVEASFVLSPNPRQLPELDELGDIRLGFLARKLFWLVLVGAFAGAVLVESDLRARLRAVGLGAASAAGLFGLVLGVSALTFNDRALADPAYRGPIKDVPRVIQLLKEVQRDWAGVRRNINKVVAGLERIHRQIVAAGPVVPQATVKLLVVSDVHNNPLGLIIAKQLVERFDVSGVLNAGDFTDRGTIPEAELFARFAAFGVPQVIVGGNHEDVPTLRRVQRMRDSVLLQPGRDTARIAGLTVLGDTDPNAYFIGDDPRNREAERQIPLVCERLRERFLVVHPEILLVHDPRMGECASRTAEEMELPLLFVWGHLHRPAYAQNGTVVSVSPGTSGANGIKTPRAAPYGFSLLEFDAQKRVVSVCTFLFEDPTTLSETSCHIQPEAGTAA